MNVTSRGGPLVVDLAVGDRERIGSVDGMLAAPLDEHRLGAVSPEADDRQSLVPEADTTIRGLPRPGTVGST
jgi:hypothetical protein